MSKDEKHKNTQLSFTNHALFVVALLQFPYDNAYLLAVMVARSSNACVSRMFISFSLRGC